MRFAIVTETFLPEVNGVAMTLGRLCEEMRAAGNQVLVIRPRQRHEKALRNGEPQPTRHRDYEEKCVRGLPIPGYESLNFGIPCTGRLKRIWRAWKPDIVYIATEGPLGLSALRATHLLKIPAVSGFHTNFNQYMANYRLPFLKRTAGGYLKWFHNCTLSTFAPSQDTLEQLEAMGLDNLRIFGRGIDTALYNPNKRSNALRAQWGAGPEHVVAIYVGRLAAEKNLALTIRAMEQLCTLAPGTQCVFVGDGPEATNLKARHPDFHFAGTQRGETLAEHYASADLFIFPSITETFGNVITEAMASGLVTVAYNYAAPKQCIESGVNGYTASFNDDAAFLQACQVAIDARPEWPALRASARASMEHLTWQSVVNAFVLHLEEALQRHKC